MSILDKLEFSKPRLVDIFEIFLMAYPTNDQTITHSN